MAGIPLDRAAILSTSLEAILYGISLFMFGTTLTMLLGRERSERNWTLIGAGVSFFVLSTIHISVDIHRLMLGLVDNREFVAANGDGPAAWFAIAAESSFVFKNAVYIVQTILWDSVVVYRCHSVWRSTRVTVFLLSLLCSIIVTGIGCVWADSVARVDVGGLFRSLSYRWITAFFCSTFVTNTISTSLLAYRIWAVNRRVRRLSVDSTSRAVLRPAFLAIVDAGLLYSATLLAALICFTLRDNAQYIVLDMIMPIISIAFYMVVIRVGLVSYYERRRQRYDAESNSDNAREMQRQLGGDSNARHAITIHVTQLTVRDGNESYADVHDASSAKDAVKGPG